MTVPRPSGSSEFWVKKDLIGQTGVIVKAPEVRSISIGTKTEDQTGFDVQVGGSTRWFNPSNACYNTLYNMLKSKGINVDEESVWVNQQVTFSEQYAEVTVKGGSKKIQQVLLAIPVGMVYSPPAGTPSTTQATSSTVASAPPPTGDRSAEIYANAQALVSSGVAKDLQSAIVIVKAQMGIA